MLSRIFRLNSRLGRIIRSLSYSKLSQSNRRADVRDWRFFAAACLALALSLGSVSAACAQSDAGGDATADATPPQWCAAELEALSDGVCAFEPAEAKTDTLVVFLHGVVKPGTTWQWAQQRAIVRAAKRKGFSVLMPRGRRGIGPAQMKDWWTWPTSVAAQRAVESELTAEWAQAQKSLESRRAHDFRRVFVIGFSNGAYYATALALLGKLKVQGYGIFAGGAGAKYLVGPAKGTTRRPRIYVGYGLKDRAHKDPKGLARALAQLGWPHKANARKRGGHRMGDGQLDAAIDFLRGSK
ncbi:MAG TPA: PHB depolymerase family esterase [Polyangiaceae bacterium]|nr:PHB depolymerase family esterase [Polyangiaceae bacterium]